MHILETLFQVHETVKLLTIHIIIFFAAYYYFYRFEHANDYVRQSIDYSLLKKFFLRNCYVRVIEEAKGGKLKKRKRGGGTERKTRGLKLGSRRRVLSCVNFIRILLANFTSVRGPFGTLSAAGYHNAEQGR